jgi:hypothetical protein
MSELTMADKVAMYVGGLVVLGTVVIGILEMALGSSPPVSGGGQIVHRALVPIEVRSYIILLGLVIRAVYVVYKVTASGPPADSGTRRGTRTGGAD